MEGYLLKRSPGPLPKWDRRWFVLDSSNWFGDRGERTLRQYQTLYYYKTEKDPAEGKAAAGKVPCSSCVLERSPSGPHTFLLRTSQRTYTLRADDERLLNDWVAALLKGGAVLASTVEEESGDTQPRVSRPSRPSISVAPVPWFQPGSGDVLAAKQASPASAPSAADSPTADRPSSPSLAARFSFGGSKALTAPTLQERAAAWPAAPPVTPEDDRPLVRDLLLQHAEELEELRAMVADTRRKSSGLGPFSLYDPRKHDDLWLLRFLLSHRPKVVEAARAAKNTMRYREEHGLDQIDAVKMDASPDAATRKLMDASLTCYEESAISWYHPDPDRGLIFVVLVNQMDFTRLAEVLTADEQALLGRRATEYSYQICDRVTRRTGRLTKVTRLIEMKGAQMAKVSSGEYQKRDQAFAKMQEDFYPQLVGGVFLCHPPSWLLLVWRTLRPLFPKRLVSKVDMVSPSTKPDEAKRFGRFLTAADLPERFGGACKTWPLPGARLGP